MPEATGIAFTGINNKIFKILYIILICSAIAIALRGYDNNKDYTALRRHGMSELSRLAYSNDPNDAPVVNQWSLVYGYDRHQRPYAFANIFQYIETMYENATGAGDNRRWGSMQDSMVYA